MKDTQFKAATYWLFNTAWDARIQEEARIANDLQRDFPGMLRSEALRLAYQLMERLK